MVATLAPVETTSSPLPFDLCLSCEEGALADLIGNLLLFVPLGFSLRHAGVSITGVALAGLLISGSIELLQLGIPGRSSALRDILANFGGACVGATLTAAWEAASSALRGASRLLCAMLYAALLPTVLATLARPHVTDADLYVHLPPRLPHLAPWEGRMRLATIDGGTLTHGRATAQQQLRNGLLHRAPVRLDFSAGPPTERLSGILLVTDQRKRELLLIGPQGDDMIIRRRRASNIIRLWTLEERIPLYLGRTPVGTSMDLTITTDRDRSCLATMTSTTCAPRTSLGSAWMFLQTASSLPSRARNVLGAITLLLMFLPLGLWIAATSERLTVRISVLTVSTLCLTSAAVGIVPVSSLSEVVAATLALLAPWLLTRLGVSAAADLPRGPT